MSPAGGRVQDVQPDWYKDAVIYEVHVRAFKDSDGDGRGDFRGLASRLDYLSQLGVTALWLLPFYPSPLKDDGYDIADYTGVHPDYGTLTDFRHFINEAHRRSIRVITELVLNHTSDQHPWFQRARRAPPTSSWRNYYVWSDSPERYSDARIIFQDFEHSNWAWDNIARSYYWHRFYSHQPDLNYNHSPVRREMLRAVDFWLSMGVDGLRLDAVPYLYEEEGTDCENLPATHEFLRTLRQHVDERFPGTMLLAEANQWPEDAIAYFGKGEGDECHMAFHFPLMPRLFMALQMEDRFPIVDIMQQTPEIPPSCQWALFLRNHDELTLEMVTDEERDYMYHAYARDPVMRVNLGIRRRLAPLLQYHRQKSELMHGLLMSLPGTPVLYYGDEIGMGDNVYLGDRDSVRTPMQWNPDRNAGFSIANPQRLFLPVNIDPQCHYESVNVSAQLDNPDSLLRWVRRLVALRKRHHVFGRGKMEFVRSSNPHVLAFMRKDDDEQILVVANLSRFAQYVELDLSAFKGMTPLEVFGQTPFPPIGDLTYLITLGPYAFYWLAMEAPAAERVVAEQDLPSLHVSGPWTRLVEPGRRRSLEAVLPQVLRSRRWFAGKDRRIHLTTLQQRLTLPLASAERRAELLVVQVEYLDGEPETYMLPVVYMQGEDAERVQHDYPEAVLIRLIAHHELQGVLVDAHYDPDYGVALVELTARRGRRTSQGGVQLMGNPTRGSTHELAQAISLEHHQVHVVKAEQSNTSLIIGDPDGTSVMLKSFRRLETGVHPELELGRALHSSGAHAARLLGAVELRTHDGVLTTMAVAHSYVLNESDAWSTALSAVGTFLDRIVPLSPDSALSPIPPGGTAGALEERDIPEEVMVQVGDSVHRAELLGQRTAELHVALSHASPAAMFAPERVTPLTQRSLYQSMRTSARRTLVALRSRMRVLPEQASRLAAMILEHEGEILETLHGVLSVRSGVRIRIHGDLHLGQVLFTGKDFVFVDFEGEPARSFGERRLKRSPLRDVSSMMRSYHYAAQMGVDDMVRRGGLEAEGPEAEYYRQAADGWAFWVSAGYLSGYVPVAQSAGLLPTSNEEMVICLRAHLFDKALYEIRYELANRPEWVHLPLLGLSSLLLGATPLSDRRDRPVSALSPPSALEARSAHLEPQWVGERGATSRDDPGAQGPQNP